MLTEKGFAGLMGKIKRAEGTLRDLIQQAIEDSLGYAIDRQSNNHGLDLRRLSTLQTEVRGMKSVSGQRLSDYIKTCLVDINGASCIGWNEKEQQYKLLKKGTVASLKAYETRGAWYEFGKPEAPKDDFDFSKRLNALLAQAEKHADKLSEQDRQLIASLRSARMGISMGTAPTGAYASLAEAAADGAI